MSSGSAWYQQLDSVAAEVRRHAAARRPIEIDGYDHFSELRRGGQGIIYTAEQVSTHRRVAIKLLLDGAFASDSARVRFDREQELIAGLRHPNIVRLYDSGRTVDDLRYFVMEYIEGHPLDELIRSSQAAAVSDSSEVDADAQLARAALTPFRSLRGTLRLFLTICDAVAFAHQRGVLHRDLKPSNIRIDPSGTPHVLDFGLAKAVGEPPDERQTALSRAGDFMGSLPWASPEQVRGEHDDIDVRTDVYSLGVILYQLLTARFPYDVTGHVPQVADNILNAEPTPPSRYRRELNEEIDAIVLTCLAKERQRRYQSAGELAADIRRYLEDAPVLARRPSAIYQIRKFAKRNRALVGGAVSAVVLLILGIAGTGYGLLQATRQRAQAVTERDRAVEAERQTATINEFLNDMMRAADPEQMGKDVTVREVLDWASERIDEEFADAPLARASLHATIGRTYQNLGLYDVAAPHVEEAVAIRTQELGPDAIETIDAIAVQASLLLEMDQLAAAVELLENARERLIATLGADHPRTTALTTDLATALGTAGDNERGRELLEETLATQRAILGSDNPETLATINNLATSYQRANRFADAERLSREALDGFTKLLGADHPQVLRAQNNHAMLIGSMGRLTDAEALYRETLEVAKRVLGDEHPITLTLAHNLASNLCWQSRYADAVEVIKPVYETRRRLYGPNHSDTIAAMSTLGIAYAHTGRLEESLEFARLAYAAQQETFGPEHPETIAALINVAGALQSMERTEEAIDVMEQALPIARATHGNDHYVVANLLNSLGVALHELHRYDEALARYREALDIVRRILPPDHHFLPWLLGDYGLLLVASADYEAAEDALRESYELYVRAQGEQHTDTQWAIRNLIRLYEAWDRPDMIEQFRAKLIPDDEPDTGQPESGGTAIRRRMNFDGPRDWRGLTLLRPTAG